MSEQEKEIYLRAEQIAPGTTAQAMRVQGLIMTRTGARFPIWKVRAWALEIGLQQLEQNEWDQISRGGK